MNEIWTMIAILSPVLAAGITAVFGAALGERCAKVGIVAVAVSAVSAIVVLAGVVDGGAAQAGISLGPVVVSVVADRLSAVLMTLISLVSLVIHVYSRRYMAGDPGYVRFYSLVGLLTFVLLSLVTSGHLLWMLVWWHSITWLLAALLRLNRSSRPACDAARRTIWIQGLGDAAFGAAVAILYVAFGTLDVGTLRDRLLSSAVPAPLGIAEGLKLDAVSLSTLCFLLAVMTKSAQFPFHIWLPGTLEAPTPVSALLHAGIVNAGGFLVNRLAPLFGHAPSTLYLMFMVGAVTALIGAASMLTQSSVKRVLVYSTMGQMGYMVMECGLGAFALAVFHLCAHGLFKATLFLNSGSNIHLARTEFQLPDPPLTKQPKEFSSVTWAMGLGLTLLLPLVILLINHGLVQVPVFELQGATIFLFFAWVTSSQAVFSLYRLHSGASWHVSALMIAALAFIGFIYLWAGEALTHFLYPAPGEAAAYFRAAAWPVGLFESFVVLSTLLVIGVWFVLYARAHGVQLMISDRLDGIRAGLYVTFLHSLYVEEVLLWWRGRFPRANAPLRTSKF